MPASPDDPRTPSAFRHRLRVYWEDTDAGGIVFYANYLKFFERARTEWLRALGVEQQALREATGAVFVVTGTAVRYHAPARLDDMLSVTVALRHRGSASMTIAQQAWRDATLVADGEIRIGCVDVATLRPRRVPAAVAEAVAVVPLAPAAGPARRGAAALPPASGATAAPTLRTTGQ